MKTTTALGLLVCCLGCHHAAPARFPQARQQPQPAREQRITIMVNTNIHGPIKYRWAYTNGPDGSKILRFVPGN
jgi:hypothetical protein